LAAAIVAEARRRRIPLLDCTAFQSISGKAASGTVAAQRVVVGSIRYFEIVGATIRSSLRQQLDVRAKISHSKREPL
jgi:cation transport ATPase